MHKKNLFIYIFLFAFGISKAQNSKFDSCIKEIYYTDSLNNTIPNNIKIFFCGNNNYNQYFFNNLEEILKEKIDEKIGYYLSYLGKKPHYTSDKMKSIVEYELYLSINNTIVIDERSGFDRIVNYELSAELISTNNSKVNLSSKIVVTAIHDITNKNREISRYIKNKILKIN